MSYRVTFSAIKGLKPNQILDYLNNQKYIFKHCFKFDYLPIITLSLNDSENELKDFTFIYPIYFDSCKDLEINFETLHKNENDDIFSYIGNWDIPKLISKQFNVKAFSFEEWEGDIDYEIFENGRTIYDFNNNYHPSYWEYHNYEEHEKALNKNAKFIPKCNPSSSFKFSNSQIVGIMKSIFTEMEEENLKFIIDHMSQNVFQNRVLKKNKMLFHIKSSNAEKIETYNEKTFENYLVGCFLSSLGLISDIMIDSNEILENFRVLSQNPQINIDTNITILKERL